MSYTLTNYITQVRSQIGDAYSTFYEEDWTSLLVGGNGTRTAYPLSHQLILTGQFNGYTSNGGTYTTSGFTVSIPNASVTFNTAPALGSGSNPSSLRFRYFFQILTDSVTWATLSLPRYDIDSFIDEGLAKLALNQTFVDTSYQNVTANQFNVICLYAKSYGFNALAGYYARTISQSAEGKSSDKSAISRNYQALAKEAFDDAEKERLALYGPRQGQSTVANFKQTTSVPRAAFWTPGR